ncbi:hypothetical protein E3N88_17758 [Mikania micrantha]|uniref:Uncharacterized protein n=1 Tax=Mikania micrantha TaxID=192012 RepID=A0A5N6NSR1_9ASTR|nr:hypothetical protein E3N88_17758 [Mikania micrantha]
MIDHKLYFVKHSQSWSNEINSPSIFAADVKSVSIGETEQSEEEEEEGEENVKGRHWSCDWLRLKVHEEDDQWKITSMMVVMYSHEANAVS